jgi:hypothetical protein
MESGIPDTFSSSKGVYGGLNLDGTVVNASDAWNEATSARRCSRPISCQDG